MENILQNADTLSFVTSINFDRMAPITISSHYFLDHCL